MLDEDQAGESLRSETLIRVPSVSNTLKKSQVQDMYGVIYMLQDVCVFTCDSSSQHVSCLINHILSPTEAALSHTLILVDIKRAELMLAFYLKLSVFWSFYDRLW